MEALKGAKLISHDETNTSRAFNGLGTISITDERIMTTNMKSKHEPDIERENEKGLSFVLKHNSIKNNGISKKTNSIASNAKIDALLKISSGAVRNAFAKSCHGEGSAKFATNKASSQSVLKSKIAVTSLMRCMRRLGAFPAADRCK